MQGLFNRFKYQKATVAPFFDFSPQENDDFEILFLQQLIKPGKCR